MNISPNITNALGRSLSQLQKHSPVILTTAGVVGVVTAGVLAARATLKLEETVDNARLRLDLAEKSDEITKTQAVTANTISLVKLYGPSITLGAVSLICIISAQNILHKRNAAIALAYKGLEETVSRFRERVRDEVGEEREKELWLGIETVESQDKDGNIVKTKTLATNAKFGDSTFIFGPDNINWQGTHEFNEFFLNTQQNVLNDLLKYRGHVTLNEALDRLGMERTAAGFVTGWKSKGEGDGFIEFRAQLLDDIGFGQDTDDYTDRGAWILDFNVDGLIWDTATKQ